MNTYIFKLDEYFYQTKKYYYFFDGMMNYEEKLKKDVLKFVDIYEVSYRADRLKEKVKNNNRKILLNYFNYNDIDKTSKTKYETCISKIYYCTYYLKLDILKDLLSELEVYINQNNYLKPLFILFKLFGTVPFYNEIGVIKRKYEKEINYLKSFLKTKYFTNNLAYLYRIVMLHFGVSEDLFTLDEYSNNIRELRWYDYTIRSSHFYFKGQDYDSLMYNHAALEEFEKSYNVERQLCAINNIAGTYNNLGKYQLSINVSEKVINYAFSQEVTPWIKLIAMHYIYSNYMLERYEEVLAFYNIIVLNEDFLNEVSVIAIIASAFKLNRLASVEQLIEKNGESRNLSIFLKAFSSIEKNEIANFLEIDDIEYLIKIAMNL